MDAEALVTFLFRAPPDVRVVELVGSWDNFSEPYQMQLDPRRGSGFYTGCFKFKNIIYDGNRSQWSKPRDGGLKQGGTYWYYYRLDMDTEAYDDNQLYTSDCPLLPGQKMNVVEVPTEIITSRERRASADAIAVLTKKASTHTLNPKDKFAPLCPPPKSKVHGRCVSDFNLVPRPQTQDSEKKTFSKLGRTSIDYKVTKRASKRPGTGDHGDLAAKNNVIPEIADLNASPSKEKKPLALKVGSIKDRFKWNPLKAVDLDARPVSRAGSDLRVGRMDVDVLSIGRPTSVQQVQFYGPRPDSVAEASEPWQPRMYALSENVVPSTSSNLDKPLPAPPQQQRQKRHDVEETWSPSFSIATLDSAGLATPYNQSASSSRRPSAVADDVSVHEVVRRLESLDASAEPSETNSRNASFSHQQPEASFTGYALPQSATDSAHSLVSKMSAPSAARSSTHQLPLPAVLETSPKRTGDLMSELVYLAGCIN